MSENHFLVIAVLVLLAMVLHLGHRLATLQDYIDDRDLKIREAVEANTAMLNVHQHSLNQVRASIHRHVLEQHEGFSAK